ncbi:hypothetical protein ACFY2R_02945 [Micromonospora olivasterospora]|uniref:Uncharacterized protein n=1 Tax=Micromonospora olivasterospora TaxID=1880 RepID=A0A562IBM7_MICOL|nr:hypothetical protein [Micromonospora olivasterospora]TWH68380.1 hypothetical protein JD77_03372 [Micromonospora olivasterospora]
MRTAAETQVRRPSAVRALTVLLAVTAAATVVVELLNWWYAPEQGFGLAVRTGWAMLRSLGFLLLIRHVNRGRAGARPVGLILAVTTVFAVGRLVVPRQGLPSPPGLAGFALLTALCVAVVALLYRSDAVRGHLVRHRRQLVVTRDGIAWRETPPKRPPVAGWLLTSRVAAFTYSPLMLVPALVAGGAVLDGRLVAVPAVLFWFVAGLGVSYAVLFCTAFLMRGRLWARPLLVAITLGVLAVDLPLCAWLLGVDGLVRDGGPLLAAAVLALYGLWRAGRAEDPAPAR